MITITRILSAAGLAGLMACQSAPLTEPTPATETSPVLNLASEGDLQFLRNAPGAPSFANTTASFWAHTKETREAKLYYHARPGLIDSTRFVRFRVPKGSLSLRPNGTPFAPTDSILITISIVDTARLVVNFAPAGLRFDDKEEARLWVDYTEVDPDRNDDGLVDSEDDLKALLSTFWKQESVGAPWESIKTSFDPGGHNYSAKITSFTRYAIAY